MSALDDSFLRIAKCGKTVGLKGDLVLWPISNVEERYVVGSTFFDEDKNEFKIESIRPRKEEYTVHFEGFDSIEQAKTLVNRELFAQALDDDVLQDGEFFAHDLLDKIVKDKGEEMGLAVSIVPNAASDLLETDKGDLIPFRFIESFDDKYIYVDAPQGIFGLGE